jgi:hypothetical protein
LCKFLILYFRSTISSLDVETEDSEFSDAGVIGELTSTSIEKSDVATISFDLGNEEKPKNTKQAASNYDYVSDITAESDGKNH